MSKQNDGGSAFPVVYQTSFEECASKISGVCEGCGGKLEPIETVDNSNNPTFWQGCRHCMCFRSGVKEIYFKIARKLVLAGEILPYARDGNFSTPEALAYYLDTQTAGLSHNIARIDALIAEDAAGEKGE
jgi:hypothetical protein